MTMRGKTVQLQVRVFGTPPVVGQLEVVADSMGEQREYYNS